jgi:transformation/transcription domain-associated protein
LTNNPISRFVILQITETETSLIDRYCVHAFPAISLICDRFGSPRSGEKPLAELHRDALTYFAAAFTPVDGYTLRRTLGKHLDLLVNAIIDDAAFLVIPRHLLGSNASTSLEFCGLLLDYLVSHVHQLNINISDDIVFYNEEEDPALGKVKSVEDILFEREQRPMQGPDYLERRSTTLLQLFERVLKSLSTYSENESVLRKHLRFLVSTCLKLTMEKPGDEPDNYFMLLWYLFRSISAGKFEESYKELLPLIPTVLNGLYRTISICKSSALRSTAIELCLTIPARLSSLLPHMNLLIRVIIPALDSDVGELINLG